MTQESGQLQKATLQASETAKYLGISYWKLLEMVKAGEIPHIRVGRRVLFRQESLDDWLKEQEDTNKVKQEKNKIRRIKT